MIRGLNTIFLVLTLVLGTCLPVDRLKATNGDNCIILLPCSFCEPSPCDGCPCAEETNGYAIDHCNSGSWSLFGYNPYRTPEYSTDTGGCGYQQCRNCPVLAPAIGLAAVALAVILAVGIRNTHESHAH